MEPVLGQLVLVLALLTGWAAVPCVAQTTSFSNRGNEFYTACTPNRVPSNTECTLFISTDEDGPVEVTVEFKCSNGSGRCSQNITATKGKVETVVLPNSNSLRVATNEIFRQRDAAVHIKAAPGKDIVVFGLNEDSASTDGLLALPVYRTPTDTYVYYTVCAPTPDDPVLLHVLSYFVIVTTEPDTTVTISPSATITYSFYCLPRLARPGGKMTCTFPNEGYLAAWTAREDLTGTKIVSNKPITVLSGHQCANMPHDMPTCDHMVEHIPPVDNWGFRFVLAPLLDRSADGYRLLASSDNALITMTCNNEQGVRKSSETIMLDEGEFVQKIIPVDQGFCCIEADTPIIVMHYSLGHTYDNNIQSDPFAIMVPPLGQYSNNYTLVFVDSVQIDTRGMPLSFQPYLTLVVPAQYYQPEKILVDNRTIDSLPGTLRTGSVSDKNGNVKAYVIRYKSQIGLGSHTVRHTNPKATMATDVYGFERENTYGFLGGLELNPLSVTTFCFSGTTFEAVEGDGAARVRIQRTGSPKEAACITMETADGTAVAGKDYTSFNKECCFAAGDVETTCEVPLVNDLVCGEDDVTFTAKLSPKPDQFACDDVAMVTIKDDDVIQVSFIEESYITSEGDGPLSVCVEVTGCTYSDPIPVALTVEGASTANQDYNSDMISITLLPQTGDGSPNTFCGNLTIIDDHFVEGLECLWLSLVTVNGTPEVVMFGSSNNVTVCIEDDDEDIFISFKVDEKDVNEGDGLVEVCLVSSEPFPEEAVLPITFSDCSGNLCGDQPLTATGGEDYDNAEAEVVFEAGSNTACVDVPINDDDLLEKNECFIVDFSIPDGPLSIFKATDGPTQLKVNIIENDVLVVSFAETQLTVGEGEEEVTLVVSGSIPSQCGYQVTVTTANGTAGAGKDFTALDGFPVQFAAMATTAMVTVEIIDDGCNECPENFTASITIPDEAARCGVVANDNGDVTTISIEDDDSVGVSFSTGNLLDVSEGDGSVTISIELEGSSEYPITLLATPTPSTAQAGRDFVPDPVEIVLQPKEVEAQFTVPIAADEILESTETFSINLSISDGCRGVELTETSLLVTVTDDDTCVVTFDPDTYSVSEKGGQVDLFVITDCDSDVPFVVNVTTSDITAKDGADFTGGHFTAMFAPNQKRAAVPVSILNDTVAEGDETFSASLSVSSEFKALGVKVGTPNKATVIIEDDDGIVCQFSPTQYSVKEDVGMAVLTLLCSGVAMEDYTLEITTANGTAQSPMDFNGGPYTVTLPAGETSATVTIPITQDSILEGMEWFTASVVVPDVAASLGVTSGADSTANVTIIDDDIVTVYFDSSTYSTSEEKGAVTVTVVADGDFVVPFDVSVITEPDSAKDPSDYTGGVFNVTFQPGEVRKMVSLTITDDEYSECPEKFLARLGIPERSTALGVVKGEPDMTTVDISDNDVIICSVDDSDSIVTVNEGVGAVNVCISCSGKSSNRFTVQLLTTDDEATGDLDYGSGPLDIEFEPGEVKKTVQVSIIDDINPETIEGFAVSLSVADAFKECGVSASDSVRLIRITDNDAISVEFDPVEYFVNEADSTVELTLVTSNVAVKDFTVTILTADGNTTGGMDFVPGPYVVGIPMGSTTVTFSIPIIEDARYEGPEYFTARIVTNSSSGITPGSSDVATINILDNDCTSFQLQGDTYCIDNGQKTASGMIEIMGNVESPVRVFLFAENTCTPGNIDSGRSTLLTFLPGGAKTQTFSLPLQEGEQLVYLPFSLQTTDKCTQVLIVDGLPQVAEGDIGVPAPSSVTTTPSVVIAAQDNSDEKTISTTEVMATTSHAPSPSPSPSPSPTPTGRPLRQYVSVHFDRDTFVVESGVTVAVLDVVLNSTVMEALCVVAVTRDGSAVGSTHYQGGQYRIVISEGTQSAKVLIPVVLENIEGSVDFFADLIGCDDNRPEETGIAFVAPNTAHVVLSQQAQPTSSTLHPSTTSLPSATSKLLPSCALVNETCYNRTTTIKEACQDNDVVVLAKLMRKRFPDSCTYRMSASRIFKGSDLISDALTRNLRINIQFPHNNCTGEPDGCINLDKDTRYLIGAQVRVHRRKKSLLALLPTSFITDDVSQKMIKKLTRRPVCAWFNGNRTKVMPSPLPSNTTTSPN